MHVALMISILFFQQNSLHIGIFRFISYKCKYLYLWRVHLTLRDLHFYFNDSESVCSIKLL